MTRSQTFRSAAGLSLLELLIALVIITVAFFAIASAQLGSLSSTANARDIAAAKTFANRSLEKVRKDTTVRVLSKSTAAQESEWVRYAGRADNNAITSGCPVAPATLPTITSTTDCQGKSTEGIYTVRWVIGPRSGPRPVAVEDEGLAVMRVQVDWQKGGQAKKLSFEDFISCADLAAALCPAPRTP
ncbi:hypothetical protein BH24DEI2_BH24DEI2_22010 [soil metagenome]